MTLYFADSESRRLVAEEREIPPAEGLEERIRATLEALVAGPDGRDFVRTLPPETRLKAAMQGGGRLLLEEAGVLDWQRDHPLVRTLNLQRLYVGEMLKLETQSPAQPDPTIKTETIIDGTLGPLVVLHREGRSAHVVVAFDLLHSNWPLRQSFPVFMHNTMA